jgi:hypothetical protein
MILKEQLEYHIFKKARKVKLLTGYSYVGVKPTIKLFEEFAENLTNDILKNNPGKDFKVLQEPLLCACFYMFNVSVEIAYFTILNENIPFEYDYNDILDCAIISATPKKIHEKVSDEIDNIKKIFSSAFILLEESIVRINEGKSELFYHTNLLLMAFSNLGYEFLMTLFDINYTPKINKLN